MGEAVTRLAALGLEPGKGLVPEEEEPQFGALRRGLLGEIEVCCGLTRGRSGWGETGPARS